MTSTPAPPWICGSMNPGTTVKRSASIRSAGSGMRTSESKPAASNLPFRITTRLGENLSAGLRTEPASMTRTRSLTPGAQMSDYLAEIAVAFNETFLRFLSIASKRTHDYGELELPTAAFRQFSRFVGIDSEHFAQNMDSAFLQFPVRHADVDHPIAVRHAKADHRGRADHVQHQFLRGTGLQSRGTHDDFRADSGVDDNVCGFRHGRVRRGNDGNRFCASASSIFQCGVGVERFAARCNSDDVIIRRDLLCLQIR